MCTYTTERLRVAGSGKGPGEWLRLRTATVYVDHPVHAMAGHTVNVDLADPDRGPAARVALELTAGSALDLVDAILDALAGVPAEVVDLDPGRMEGLLAARRGTRPAVGGP